MRTIVFVHFLYTYYFSLFTTYSSLSVCFKIKLKQSYVHFTAILSNCMIAYICCGFLLRTAFLVLWWMESLHSDRKCPG